MAQQQKFISSHRARVNRANEYVKNSPEKISIFDREAIVEFYLLEDIVRLYEYRLKKAENSKETTRAGEMARARSIKTYTALIDIFNATIASAKYLIDSGYYTPVWKAIPEHNLMVAASNVKYLPQMRDLAVDMVKRLSQDSLAAEKEANLLDEALDEIEDHEGNVRSLEGLPTESDIGAIIEAVTAAIPDEPKSNSKRKGQNLA